MNPDFSALGSSDSNKLPDEKAKFISTANVLISAQNYDYKISGGEDFLDWSSSNRSPRKIKPIKEMPETASRFLRIAWQTELASQIPFQYEDLIMKEVSIQIFPVQTYYSLFNSIRSLCHILGQPIDSHIGIRKHYSLELSKYTKGSWSVRLQGNPDKYSECKLENINYQPEAFNPVYSGQESEGYLWSMLQTARRYNLHLKGENWLKSKEALKSNGQRRKNISSEKRTELAQSDYPTTMLDYLYKLRCDTNYKSVDEFSSDYSTETLDTYYHGLNYVLQSGLFAIETQISQLIGPKTFREEFSNWSKKLSDKPGWIIKSPQRRVDLITLS